MEIERFDIEGLLLIKPRVFKDARGYFIESFNNQKFEAATGIKPEFVQDNESMSVHGTLRGLHYQEPDMSQSKLVRVVQGKVQDVAVDLRANSPTFGQHVSVILDDDNKHQFYVPKGFAHAFLVLSDTAIFSYKVDNYYSPKHDAGIKFDDPDLNIDWVLENDKLILSNKDQNLQSWIEYKQNPKF